MRHPTAVASVLFALTAACAVPPEAPAPRRPNVLFLAVDDLRPELGCYGAAHVRSPNIDRLAARGVVFTRAYCQQALCNPSRASLMTGLRPDTLRVWDLKTDFRSTTPAAVTLAQHFRQHGYFTTAIGKIFHNTLPDPLSWSEPKLHVPGYPFDPDAIYRLPANVAWLAERQQELEASGQAARRRDRFGHVYLKHVATECADVGDDAYYDGAQTGVAIERLRALAAQRDATGQPFFLAVGFYRPHLPFTAPRKYWDLYDPQQIPLPANPDLARGAPPMATNTMRELRGYTDYQTEPRPDQGRLAEDRVRQLRHGYLAAMSYTDAQVGRLLDELDRLGLAADTIVVLFGDHGWKLGEQGSFGKMTNFEIDARVPLVVAVPGAAGNGLACDRLVEFVDLYPGLCDLAGLPLRPELEGQSLAPLLGEPERPWKEAAFTQFLRHGVWVAPDGVEYMGRSIRTGRWRYTEWRRWVQGEGGAVAAGKEDGPVVARELYDHGSDPLETVNIAVEEANAALCAGLAARLAAGWRGARAR
jgi:choline-sulfatase